MESNKNKKNLIRNILIGAAPAVGALAVLLFAFTGDKESTVESPEKEIPVEAGAEVTTKEEEVVTRAETAKLIVESLGVEVNVENVDPVLYKDINEQTDGYAEIAQLTEWGVFKNSAEFKPEAPLKKSELPKIIAEAFSLKVDKDPAVPKAKETDYKKVVYDNQIIPAEFGEDKDVTKTELKEVISTVEKVVKEKPELVDKNKTVEKENSLSKNENLIVTDKGTLEEVTIVNENTADSQVGQELATGQSKNFELEDGSTVIVEKDSDGKITTITNKVVGSISEEETVLPVQPVDKETVVSEKPNAPEKTVEKPVSNNGPTIDTNKNYSKHEDIQVALEKALNEYRASKGVNSVKIVPNLTQAAGFRSWDMIENDYFSHVSPIYGGFAYVLEQFNPESPFGTEVIASMVIGRGAEGDAKAALENFKSSPMHNEAILTAGYDKIGVGVDTSSDGYTTVITIVIGY